MLFVGANASTGRVCKYGHLTMWAEHGFIRIIDSNPKTDSSQRYTTVAVRSALHRIKGISDMIKNTRRAKHSHDQYDSAKLEVDRRMVEEMTEICRLAQIQGTPDDPSAARALARARPTTVVVSNPKAIM